MKNVIQIFNRLILAFMICCLIFSGNALAAEKKINAMNAFREAMLAPDNSSDKVFKQVLTFYDPDAAVNLQFLTQIKDNSEMRLKGSVDFFYNDKTGETQKYNIPFYVDQNKEMMNVYYKFGASWEKYNLNEIAPMITEILTSSNNSNVEDDIKLAKKVELLSENENRRTMLIHLNGEKFYNMIKEQDAKSESKQPSTINADDKDTGFKYLETALKKSDIHITWTIDKTNWQTVTSAVYLSDFIQQLARLALDQSDFAKDKDIRNMIEMVAFYGELKAYTTYLNPENVSIEIPAEVLNAKATENILPNTSTTSTEK